MHTEYDTEYLPTDTNNHFAGVKSDTDSDCCRTRSVGLLRGIAPHAGGGIVKKVMLEIGHGIRPDGGFDPGAEGVEQTTEWSQAVVMASEVAKHLTVLSNDTLVSIKDTAVPDPSAMHKALEQEGYSCFVSLHLNAYNRAVQGSEVLIRGGRPEDVALSHKILDALDRTVAIRNRGMRDVPNLRILRGARVPSCLVEPFFLDAVMTRGELQAYVQLSAKGIALGILDFLEAHA